MRQTKQVEHSSAQRDKRLWNRIWQLQVPPKLKLLSGGRALTYSQPARIYVERRSHWTRHVQSVSNMMRRWLTLFWGCPMARNVWALVEGMLQKRSSFAKDFYSLVRELTPVLTKNEMEVWAIVSWAIWNARNRYIFDRKQTHPSNILRGAMTLLQD